MFKIKVDKSQFSELELKVRDKFKDVLSDADLNDQIGAFVKERVVYQARTRKPLSAAGSFPAISDGWIKERKALEKTNTTAATYSNKRSNLTFTGQLLDSYDYDVIGPGQIELKFKGDHKGYTYGNGQTGKSVPNEIIAQGLKEKGFVVIDRSIEQNKKIIERIKSIALTFVRRSLRNVGTRV